MKANRVLRLTQSFVFQRPERWAVQARYAYRPVGPQVVLPPDAWLLELGPFDGGLEGRPEYRYRTAGGETLALGAPLPEVACMEVIDPEAVRSMNAYRDLETLLAEDLGLNLLQMDPTLPPFALIRCPLCGSTSFTTVDLASAWCDRCNAQFLVRATAGDPGFVVDCTWPYYDPAAAWYILPRTRTLQATLVLKNSGDPRDLRRADCGEACKNGALPLTDSTSGLRAGLHAYKIGTLYDWRTIYGTVPQMVDLEENEGWEIDGQSWPRSATARVLPLRLEERQALEGAREALQDSLPETAGAIQTLLAAPARSPSVRAALLPDPRDLEEGERYLLHHWVYGPQNLEAASEIAALPVWYVVTPRWAGQRLAGWEVVQKNICPQCARPVAAEAAPGSEVHADCRATWEKTGWRSPAGFSSNGKANG